MPFVASSTAHVITALVMSAGRRVRRHVAGSWRSRFADAPARFRTAVAGGFVVAAVGALVLGTDRSGSADSFLDLFGGALFGQAAPDPTQPSGAWHRLRAAVRHRAHPAHVTRTAAMSTVTSGVTHRAPVALARRSMCVRLCDGFAFPVGDYHGEGDRAPHEAACQSQCPGARTALYVTPVGADTMREAVRVGTGQTYSALPDAFHYASVLSDACSCHPPSGNRIPSLLRDFTLRRGDAVMTAGGVRVFHGGAHYPFSRGDFVALARSPDVREADRRTFHAIERASARASTVAEAQPARRAEAVAANDPDAATTRTIR